MGAYKGIEAFVSFARYLLASAFIPLLILWARRPQDHRQSGAAPADRIIFSVITIGVIGLVCGLAFKRMNRGRFRRSLWHACNPA